MTFTKPTLDGPAACSRVSTVEEGTTSGVIEIFFATHASSLTKTLETSSDSKFDYDDTSTISSSAVLDYANK